MASVPRSFPPPTAAPLALYTPGLTGIDSSLPTHSTAFGWALQRVRSLTTTASTVVFEWLSRDNLSRRPLDLPATPTSKYCPGPTTTLITTGNFSLAISVIPTFVILVSLLLGAGMVHFGRRGGSSISPLTVSRQKAKNAKALPRSLYTDSPTLFHQDATVLSLVSYVPRLSSLRISALSLVLRGLAFLFRLVCVEKLLNMVEDSAADHKVATSSVSYIAELRILNRRVEYAMEFATPTPTGVSPACLPDANKTVVAPFTPAHAKSKLERVFAPSSDDKVDVILLPEEVTSCPLTYIHIDPASSHKASASPAIAEVLRVEPLGDVYAAATSVVRFEGGDGVIPSFPTSTRCSSFRSTSPNMIVAPPSGVPDTPLPTSSPVYKSSYQPFGRGHLSSGNHMSTPSRNNVAVSGSVEPSGVPDRVVAFEPRAESSSLAEVRRIFQRCLEYSPQRQRCSKPLPATPSVRSEPHSESVFQAEVQQTFRPCFDDSRLQHTTALASSVCPIDPPLGMDTSHHENPSDKQEGTGECPKPTPQKDVTVLESIPKDFRLQSPRNRSTTDAEINHISAVQDLGQTESTRQREGLLSNHSPTHATPKRDDTATRCNSEAIREHTTCDETENQPRHVTSAFEKDGIAAGHSQTEVRRGGPSRSVEATSVDSAVLRTSLSTSCERVNKTFARDSRLSSQGFSVACTRESRGHSVQTVTPPSKHRSFTTSGEWDPVARLHSLLELVVPLSDDQDQSVSMTDKTSWSFEGYIRPEEESVEPSWRLEDHIPVASDDESWSDSLTADDLDTEKEESTQSWHQGQAQSPPPTPSLGRCLQPSCSYSEPSRNRLHSPINEEDHRLVNKRRRGSFAPSTSERWHTAHSPIEDRPQIIYDVFYSPNTFASSTPDKRTGDLSMSFDKEDQPKIIHDVFYSPTTFTLPTPKRCTTHSPTDKELRGFGIGSPSHRRMQRPSTNPRDTFYTSTPRVNYAQFGGFSTSTPRRDVDNRRDTWADFF